MGIAKRNGWFKPAKNSSDHSELFSALRSQSDTGARTAAAQLKALRIMRNIADYDSPAIYEGNLVDFEIAYLVVKQQVATIKRHLK